MTRSFALISCFIAGILPAFAQQNADFLKPSSTIKIDLLANHYLHVSRDGFTAIDVLSKYSFVTIDLTNSLQQKKSLTDPLAFNFRTSEASQHNIATVMSDKRVDASSQMYLYSFIDLTKGEKLFDALMIVKKKGNNYLGELVGTKYKKIDGQDRFLIVMRFKNVFDNSVILKGWLMKKDGLVPPIIA